MRKLLHILGAPFRWYDRQLDRLYETLMLGGIYAVAIICMLAAIAGTIAMLYFYYMVAEHVITH